MSAASVLQQRPQADVFGIRLAADRVQSADFEQLIDELIQSLQFGFHRDVELLPIFRPEDHASAACPDKGAERRWGF